MGIDVKVENGVATLALTRPEKLNAMTNEMAAEFESRLRVLAGDPDVRVLVMTGTDRSFSVGSDITELGQLQNFVDYHERPEYADSLRAFEKPVIAMINGYALGGGLELALSCDVRIASVNSRFGATEINLGWIGRGGNTQLLPRLIGYGAAAQMVFTGELVSAEQAMRWGLVQQVVDPDELQEAVEAMASTIAEKSPFALKLAKRALQMSLNSTLESGLRYEWELATLCFATQDKDEGIRAFQEGRKPRFEGK